MLCAKQNLTEGEQIMSKFLSNLHISLNLSFNYQWFYGVLKGAERRECEFISQRH